MIHASLACVIRLCVQPNRPSQSDCPVLHSTVSFCMTRVQRACCHQSFAVSQQTSQVRALSIILSVLVCYGAEASNSCRGNPYVECPYSHARFQPACKGQISPVGEIARIGADASGLMCSNTQR